MSKKTLFLIIILILLGGGAYYWFFVQHHTLSLNTGSTSGQKTGNGIFAPFGTGGGAGTAQPAASTTSQVSASSTPIIATVSVLREISSSPVGGMIASTTASTTIVRWIDRGTGHIYQAYEDNTAIDEISDMTVPMIYLSYWDSVANAFILSSLNDTTGAITNFYAVLTPVNASTSSSTTPYTLTGSPLSSQTLALAVSPANSKLSNRVFTLVSSSAGGSAGYISNFDGTGSTQIFTTPLTQVNAQWPASNTIAITTKASASDEGFLYFINPKNGAFNKIIGNLYGLSTLVNPNATEVFYSYTNSAGTGISSAVYNISTGQNTVLPFDTLAEKCVWSTLQTNDIYCAIPSNIPSGTYPDSWYQGTVSFNDSLWEIDTITGDINQLVDLTKVSGVPMDVENMQLSPDENFLYFINKKDLSLWSFNLNAI